MMTQKEIAGKIGVSRSSVSHFLNQRWEFLGEDLQKKIAEAIDEYGYKANFAAKTLRLKESRMIGILMPTYGTPNFMSKMDAIETLLFRKGYTVLLGCTQEKKEKGEKYVREFIGRDVDGVLYTPSLEFDDTPLSRQLTNQGIPVVVFDPVRDYEKTDSVSVDRKYGTCEATEYLIRLGHTRIANFTVSLPWDLKFVNLKLNGYKEALKKNKIEFRSDLVFDIYPLFLKGLTYYEAAYQTAKELLKNNRKENLPTALITANDETAMAAIKAFGEAGVSVPGDISVIGFDDIEFSQYFIPSLTTVSQPKMALAEAALKMLLRRIQNPSASPEEIVIKPQLEIRGSAAAPNNRIR